jgi:hypothetical protein
MAKKKDQVPAKRKEQLPAEYDYGDDAGAGFEHHTKEDFLIPMLYVLQDNSPVVEDVKEAKAGMMMNSVTQDLYDGTDGLTFVPCYKEHKFVEWVPRDDGGGFVGVHDIESDIVRHCRENQPFGKYTTEAGNDLIETYYMYGILLTPDGGAEQIVIPFSSTKIKKYKAWQNKSKGVAIPLPSGGRQKPPLWAVKYKFTTVREQNKKGKFWNFAINFEGGSAMESLIKRGSELYESALAVKEIAETGEGRVDYTGSVQDAGGDDGSDNVPF